MFILQALYYFLPAYVANMAPVIFKNPLPQPIDFHRPWHNKRIFGDNKTWGGLIAAIITGSAVFILQQSLNSIQFFQSLAIINYKQSMLFGILMATGAILGDLAKSFIKRRLNKQPGEEWFPFDQIDYVIGALLFTLPLYAPPLKIIIALFVLAPVLHYTVNYIAFLLGLKKVRW